MFIYEFSDSARLAYNLLKEMLQEFLRIVIDIKYSSSEAWKDEAYKEIKDNTDKATCRSIVKDIQNAGGVKQFDFTNMDVSDSLSVLRFNKFFKLDKVGNRIFSSLTHLNTDRQQYAHDKTMPNSWWFETSICTLHDMDSFREDLLSAEKLESPHKERIQSFCEKYRRETDRLRTSIQKDYDEILEAESVTQILLNILSDTNTKASYEKQLFEKIYNSMYFYYLGLTDQDKTKLARFLVYSTKTNVDYCFLNAGDFFYYYYYQGLYLDYYRAADYYEKYLQLTWKNVSLNKDVQCKLASIYINGKDIGHTPDEGKAIIASLEENGYRIETYQRKDGFIEYKTVRYNEKEKSALIQQQNETYEAVKKTLEFWDKNNSTGNEQKG